MKKARRDSGGLHVTPEGAGCLPAVSAAAAAATAAAAAILAGTSDVHLDGATVKALAVEGADGSLGLGLGAHLDEAEAAGAARLAIGDDGGALDRAMRGEGLAEARLGSAEGEIADVKLVVAHANFRVAEETRARKSRAAHRVVRWENQPSA